MELKPVKSTNLEALGHDPESLELQVEFKAGGVYAYDGVPAALVQEILAAKSIGSAFHTKIIKGGFTFRKLK